MRGGFGPRFVVEAMFLVLVAGVAGLAQFPTEAIILVMALAWLLVAGVEWALARPRAFPGGVLPRRRAQPLPPAPQLDEAQHVRVLPREVDPSAQPVIERRPEPSPPPELDAPPAPEPTPPVVEPALAEPTPTPELPAAELARVGGGDAEAPAEAAVGEGAPAAAEPTAAAVQAEAAEAAWPEPPERRERPLEAMPPREPQAEPQPEPERPPLVAVAPEPEPVPEPPREERVVPLRPQGPRTWNLWELERLARDQAGADAQRDEERAYLLMYLREFATPEGTLPADFDPLVRESFGELIELR
jgi:hypothetical protein